MPDRDAAEKWMLAQADHDIAIAFAQFCKRFPTVATTAADSGSDENALLYLVMISSGFPACKDFGEWSHYADDYKVAPLPKDVSIKKSSPVVAARAIYLRAAITRLLEIVEAPPFMIEDVKTLLAPLCPKGAVQRAKAQGAILENPNAGVRGAATTTKTSAGQISNDRQAGTLITPTQGVWSALD